MAEDRFAAIADQFGNFFVLDCTVSESHNYSSEITSYPAEEGSDFSDNIRNEQFEISIESIVSDTPLATIAKIRSNATATKQTLSDASNFAVLSAVANGNLTPPPATPSKPSDDILAHLLAIHEARMPVKIVTSLKSYDSMALQSLEIPRDAALGAAIRFTAKFRHIRVIANRRYVRVSAPRAMGPKTRNTAPKPSNNNDNYNDRLPIIQVVRRGGDYLWFDDAIGGWRLSAIHDPPSEANNSSTPRTGSAYSAAAEGWVCFRDRPFGVSQSDWISHRKTNQQYKNDISAANAAAPRDPDGDIASVNSNVYDPFATAPGSTDDLGNDISQMDKQFVHARIASPSR